jgi:ABC-type sugar transport system ATPase subunit
MVRDAEQMEESAGAAVPRMMPAKAAAGPAQARPKLRATGLRKRFDGVEVLHGVDLDLRAGEVHALVGENGAGKSTIINLLSGRLRPDAGRIELDGVPVGFRNPLAARQAGISMIAQELEVVPTLTVVENIFLGAEPTRYGLVRWGEARRKVVSILGELGVDADPDRVVGTIGVADQQLVEIAKAIVGEFGVLIMDEPTSALNLEDVDRLFKIVRRLRADGVAVLYVSHRLWEVFDLADRVTVVRDGNRIVTTEIARTDVDSVIHAMLGDKSSLLAEAGRPRRARAAPPRGARPVLELEGVQSGALLRDIGLDVHEGEVIGLAGVLGSGRTELCEAIYGLRRIDSGEMRLRGEAVRIREPKEALRRGLCLLSEDRKSEGIFAHLDVRENVILDYNPALAEAGRAPAEDDEVRAPHRAPRRTSRIRSIGLALIHPQVERRAFDAMRESLSIRCSGPGERITALSGGNQQKTLFARAALAQPVVLLLSEPTRGVDVGAKEEIYSAIDAFAAKGTAMIVSSSEIGELMRLATRIYVLRNGRIVARLAVDETSEADILRRMAG